MTSATFKLGKLAGVEIGINITLIAIAALITFSMAEQYFPSTIPGRSDGVYLALSVVTAILFFASILWHEMAHALMSRYFNVPVKRIVLNVIGGMAIVDESPRKAHHEFWIYLVGPLSTLALGGMFLGISFVIGRETLIGAMFLWLGRINLLLGAFNMIPGFPLDGGGVLRASIWFISKNYLLATRIASGGGQLVAFGFAGFALLETMRTGSFYGGLWMLFIAWFLWSAARDNLRVAKIQYALQDIPITEAILGRVKLQPDWSIIYALDVMSMNGSPYVAPVMRDEEMIGVFAVDAVRRVPRISWGNMRVGSLMRSLAGIPSISAETDVFHALRKMEQSRAEVMLVERGMQTIGIIGWHELVRFAERKRRARTSSKATQA